MKMKHTMFALAALGSLESCARHSHPTARHVVQKAYHGPLALLNAREVSLPSVGQIKLDGEWVWPAQAVLVGDFGDGWTRLQWAGDDTFVDEWGAKRADCRCLGVAALGTNERPLMAVWYYCGDYRAGAEFFSGPRWAEGMIDWLVVRGVNVPN